VGYERGGVLTEAVRRRPYSVVLLDEVEKAHPDVHEMFYQVFDKGWMEDSDGRYIDFKNTVILLTSNVGTDLIAGLCKDPALRPEPDALTRAVREPLRKVFPPALLGRLVVVPYYPLADEILGNVVRLQLDRIVHRIREQHGVPLIYDDAVVALVVSRCTEVESGGRMIDAILTNTILPRISEEYLSRAVDGRPLGPIGIGVKDGEFSFEFA
jgi:type VI secretion system protein VasG